MLQDWNELMQIMVFSTGPKMKKEVVVLGAEVALVLLGGNYSDFWPQNWEIINESCFKLLNLG